MFESRKIDSRYSFVFDDFVIKQKVEVVRINGIVDYCDEINAKP